MSATARRSTCWLALRIWRSDGKFRELADRAAFVRRAIRESYRVESPDHDASIVTATGERETIPSELTREVVAFLRASMEGNSYPQGKDYEGETASEAEVHFKLGDASSRERDTQALTKGQESSPFVLKIPPDEIELLASQPGTSSMNCANCCASNDSRTNFDFSWTETRRRRTRGSR